MKNKASSVLQPFKVPLIILALVAVGMVVLCVVVPSINASVANSTPIVSIEAENTKVYTKGDEISLSDFTVTATHENGKSTKLNAEDYELSSVSTAPTGDTTEITVYLAEDHNISCVAEVSMEREKVVGFQCGYPEVSNVTAVLYSNGELCFEGSGDVLVCSEGDFPWLDYDDDDDYPITAVSFEEGVTPTDMNYWFEDIETLTYVAPIPASVKTMVRTFSDCSALTVAADWSACSSLLNVNEIYDGCTALVETYPLLPSIRTAERAYADCISLLACPDSSAAESLANCTEMYEGCEVLVKAEIPTGAQDITGIFSDCINLKDMPTIPDGVKNMTSAFEDDVSLTTLTAIPAGVETLTDAFSNCQLIHGDFTIDCNVESFENVFSGACVATKLNLIGASALLDAYANTNEYGNVYVNGVSPNTGITDYQDVFDASGNLLVAEPSEPSEPVDPAVPVEDDAESNEAPVETSAPD